MSDCDVVRHVGGVGGWGRLWLWIKYKRTPIAVTMSEDKQTTYFDQPCVFQDGELIDLTERGWFKLTPRWR